MSTEWCLSIMAMVTRENAARVLADLTPDQRTQFEWWFVSRYGDHLPTDRRVYLGSAGTVTPELQDEIDVHDVASRFGAMHRAILNSREPL